MLTQLRTANTGAFDQKSTAQDRQKPQQNDQIFTAVIQTGWLHDVTAVSQAGNTDQA